MNTLDIILLAVSLIGFVMGFKTGLVRQITLGAGIVVGLLLAVIHYPSTGLWLMGITGWNELLCSCLGFVMIFLAAVAVLSVVGYILRWLLKLVLLGFIDRILGGLLATFIAALLLSIVVNCSVLILPENSVTGKTSQKNSLLYKEVAKVTGQVINEVRNNR